MLAPTAKHWRHSTNSGWLQEVAEMAVGGRFDYLLIECTGVLAGWCMSPANCMQNQSVLLQGRWCAVVLMLAYNLII